MRKIKSFGNRLIRRVLLTVFAIMMVTLVVTLYAGQRAVGAETRGRYLGIMNVVNEKLGRILKVQEIGTMNVVDEVEHNLKSPETVIAAMEKKMGMSNNVKGYFTAFEPDYYPQKGTWFEPYVYKQKNGEIAIKELGTASHDYHQSKWYIRAKKEDVSFWTDPYYFEPDPGEKGAYSTFVMPLHDQNGRFIGVCGADMSLDWLTNELKIIDIQSKNTGMHNIDEKYRDLDFYTFIINNDGTYIAHPEERRVLKDNVLDYVKRKGGEQFDRIVHDMLHHQSGMANVHIDGTPAMIYYAPLEYTNWSMAIVVPRRAMGRPIILLALSIIGASILGIIILNIITHRGIRQATKPLESLAHSADEVAKGNFDSPLPEIKYNDEICQLRDSFATMQQSLVSYIHDLEVTTAKKAAIESELSVAHRIQMSMVPSQFPPFPKRTDIDIYGSLTPAKSIGGDLFDFFIRDEHLYFCIGDVSGKGVPAALMMTVIRYLFRSVANHVDEASEIVRLINDCFSASNDSLLFCTFFLGVLDLKTGHLQYCNAGHERPFLISSGVQELPLKPNMALGVMEGTAFAAQDIQLTPDTTLFLYTDGLTDAANPEEQRLGRDRIVGILQQAVDEGLTDATSCVRYVTDRVNAYVKDAPQADDLTLFAIRNIPS